MPNACIDKDLAALVQQLSTLRIATPVEHPDYGALEARYRQASDLQEKAINKAIDDTDNDYICFSKEMKYAINDIKKAQKKIEKVAKAIVRAAKVLDLAGKIVDKLA